MWLCSAVIIEVFYNSQYEASLQSGRQIKRRFSVKKKAVLDSKFKLVLSENKFSISKVKYTLCFWVKKKNAVS